MDLVPRDLELSRRRSACREHVLVYLAAARRASLWEVSTATGIRPSRVVGIVEGAPGVYSAALSLRGLGAVEVRVAEGARWYAITSLGERVAWRALEGGCG